MRPLLLTLLFLTPISQAQFTLQQSHTTAGLRGIHAIGNGIAWASGTNGTILRTTDQGKTWQTCPIPPNAEQLDFRGIQAFDANTAIVMSSGTGDLSRLYKTTNACQSWTLLFTNPDKEGFWDALIFKDTTNGYLLGDPVDGHFYLAETNDGGKHWNQQRNDGLAADAATHGAFAASNSSLTVKNGHIIFGTGGTAGSKVYELSEFTVCVDDCSGDQMNLDGHSDKWITTPIPMASGKDSAGIFSLGERALVAVGGDYRTPEIGAGSADFRQGKTWQPAQTPPHGYRSSVAYAPTQKLWITVGPNGTDISTDDGQNWHALRPGPTDAPDADKNWNALSLPFVVGPHGRIGLLESIPSRGAP